MSHMKEIKINKVEKESYIFLFPKKTVFLVPKFGDERV